MKRPTGRLVPGFIEPCIPTLVSKPPNDPRWVHEIKHDGYRLMVRRDGGKVTLFTRRGHDWTARYPSIAASALSLSRKRYVIDGEAVVPGEDGIGDFAKMRGRLVSHDTILYAFDLLEIDGRDIRSEPLLKRKGRLERLVGRDAGGVVYNEHLEGDSALIFKHACRMGFEGIVSKRIDLPYRSGRTSEWLKTKNPESAAAKRHAEGRW